MKLKPSFKSKNRGRHAKVKWMGYDSSHNQLIKLSKLRKTAIEVVKTLLRGKEQVRVSLRPIKRT